MPLNFSLMFNSGRLFDWRPVISPGTVYFLLAVFGALVIVGLVIKIVQKAKKRENFFNRLFSRYAALFLVMGILGVIYVWFRFEKVLFFSARLWLWVWLIGFIVWLVFIIRYHVKTGPQARKQSEQKRVFNKYLPRKN